MGQCCSGGDGQLFGGSRSKRAGQTLATDDFYFKLANDQLFIDVLVSFQGIWFSVWLFLSLISGFSLYDGNSNAANAITHFGWWALVEFWACMFGFRCTGLRLSPSANGPALEKTVQRASNFLTVYIVVLIAAVVFNIVHIALSFSELAYCSSTLCAQEKGFLIVFIAMLFVVAFVVELVLIYRAFKYQRDLVEVWERSADTFGKSLPREEEVDEEKAAVPTRGGVVRVGPAEEPQETALDAYEISTPLLAAAYPQPGAGRISHVPSKQKKYR